MHQVVTRSSVEQCFGNDRVHSYAGAAAAADDKKSLKAGGGGSSAASATTSKPSDDRKGTNADLSKGVVSGGGTGSIGDAERRKVAEANTSRASSAPGATGASR
jgi:surface antigen